MPDQTFDITLSTLREIMQCGKEIRDINSHAANMEEVAGKIVEFLYATFVNG
jgi:hypothetical protein